MVILMVSPHYNQDYTWEEISAILKAIKDCVERDRFSISKNENRQENLDFIRDFNLTNKRIKEILMEIKPEDFCHSLQNKKPGFEHEILYVFCTVKRLADIHGVENDVSIYIKFNLIEYSDGKNVVVISFHKLNRPIGYLFK